MYICKVNFFIIDLGGLRVGVIYPPFIKKNEMAKQKNKLEEICKPEIINRLLTFETCNFMIGDEKCKIVSTDSNPHKISVRRLEGVKTYNQSELIKLLKL